MLKMIIADDESIVREGIRDILDWGSYGINIVGEATNGLEAVELCRMEKADILFTDVKMPIMDGLQAAQMIKEDHMDVKVIIFSGIQEFEYAKKAIKVSAEGYILKPLEKSELIQVVRQVAHQIEVETNRKQMMVKLKNQIKENHLAAEEKFLRDLLFGPVLSKDKLRDKSDYFNLPIVYSDTITIGVLAIDDYAANEGQMELERQLLMFSIKNVVDEVVGRTHQGICVNLSENEYAVIVKERDDNTMALLFETVVTELSNVLGLSVSIGISQPKVGMHKAQLAFKEGRNALRYKFYMGKQAIINYTDIHDEKEPTKDFDVYRLGKELIELVKLGNSREAEEMIHDMYAKLNEMQGSISYIRSIGIEIAFTLSRLMDEFGKSMDDVTDDKNVILQTIQTFENIFDLKSYIVSIVVAVSNYFSGKFRAKNERLVDEIREIIEKEYMNNINVNRIAQHVYLSPNYISQIFKKETGKTITDCLTHRRMEAAKDLLKETDLKIQQISEMVGYEDASYFSKVFKKQTGIYPQKYRMFLG